jgi:hypothetical protein
MTPAGSLVPSLSNVTELRSTVQAAPPLCTPAITVLRCEPMIGRSWLKKWIATREHHTNGLKTG